MLRLRRLRIVQCQCLLGLQPRVLPERRGLLPLFLKLHHMLLRQQQLFGVSGLLLPIGYELSGLPFFMPELFLTKHMQQLSARLLSLDYDLPSLRC